MLATFGMQAPGDVYPSSSKPTNRRVALGGLRPELRCNRGHGLHMFEQQLERAEAEFLAALARSRRSAPPTCARPCSTSHGSPR